MDEAHSLEMKMATAFVKCMCIRWRGSGLCGAVGCVHIEASPKRNSRFTWDSLSLFTTCESGAKRCWARSLSYSSQKTPESNKSVQRLTAAKRKAVTIIDIGEMVLCDLCNGDYTKSDAE